MLGLKLIHASKRGTSALALELHEPITICNSYAPTKELHLSYI